MVPDALMFLVGGFVITALLEVVVLSTTRRLQLMAVPNARSSHEIPTPTLGGIAMVLTIVGYLCWQTLLEVPGAGQLLAGGLVLALVGLKDDLSELAALPRFICHIGAVALVLHGLALPVPWLLLLVIGFAMVWHVNLYNFMDGIDGIAVSQLLLFCVGVLIISGGIPGWLGELVWLTAGTSLAFAAFNWPPAKIFMGDVGSGFFGLLLGFLVVALAQADRVPFIASLILLAGFWFDASYTLCVRIVTGQRFASAHRSHLYQLLAARRGHRWTTGLFVVYGLLWLLPLSALATQFDVRALETPFLALGWLLAAALPPAFGAVRFGAGRLSEPQ